MVGNRLLHPLPDLLFIITSRDALVRLIMETGASTRTIWTKAANLFLDNKASRAMTLKAKFRALSQGDLPVLKFMNGNHTLPIDASSS